MPYHFAHKKKVLRLPMRRRAVGLQRTMVRHRLATLYCLSAVLGAALSAADRAAIAGGGRSGGAERRADVADAAAELPQSPRPTPALGRFNKSVPVYASPDGKHYMVDVQLGWRSNASEPQVARLILDTGSGDTVVFGQAHCDARRGEFSHTAAGGRGEDSCYDYTRSASFKFNAEGLGRRLNHDCVYGKPGHAGAYCKEALLIDGYKAEVMCELAWEDVGFAVVGTESTARGMTRSDVCVVNDTATEAYKMRYWNNSQGTLGLFFHACEPGQGEAACHNPFPAILSPPALAPSLGPIFTLDLNAPGAPSRLHLGAPAAGWADTVWGETQVCVCVCV